ncbi:hypothetical protein AB4572_23540, partial [Vibrio splendidus]
GQHALVRLKQKPEHLSMLGLCFSNLVYVAASYFSAARNFTSACYFAAIRFTFRFYSLAIASLI